MNNIFNNWNHVMIRTLFFSVIYITLAAVTLPAQQNQPNNYIYNEYFGNLPSIVKKYEQKLEETENELEKEKLLGNQQGILQVALIKKAYKKEYKEAVEAYAQSFKFPKPIALKSLQNSRYMISLPTVLTATSDAMQLTFTVLMLADIKTEYGTYERALLLYFKAIDKEGKDIPNSYCLGSELNNDMKAGAKFDLKLAWRNSSFKNFENFAKLVQVSKEEYESAMKNRNQ